MKRQKLTLQTITLTHTTETRKVWNKQTKKCAYNNCAISRVQFILKVSVWHVYFWVVCPLSIMWSVGSHPLVCDGLCNWYDGIWFHNSLAIYVPNLLCIAMPNISVSRNAFSRRRPWERPRTQWRDYALGWPGNTSGSVRMSWKEWLGPRKSGCYCWNCCPYDLTLDNVEEEEEEEVENNKFLEISEESQKGRE